MSFILGACIICSFGDVISLDSRASVAMFSWNDRWRPLHAYQLPSFSFSFPLTNCKINPTEFPKHMSLKLASDHTSHFLATFLSPVRVSASVTFCFGPDNVLFMPPVCAR